MPPQIVSNIYYLLDVVVRSHSPYAKCMIRLLLALNVLVVNFSPCKFYNNDYML